MTLEKKHLYQNQNYNLSKRRKYLLARLIRYEKQSTPRIKVRKIFKLGMGVVKNFNKKYPNFFINKLPSISQWLKADAYAHSSVKFTTEALGWTRKISYLQDCTHHDEEMVCGYYYYEFSKRYKRRLTFNQSHSWKIYRHTFYLWHLKKRITKRLVRIVKRKHRKPIFSVRHYAKLSNNLLYLKALYSTSLPVIDIYKFLVVRVMKKQIIYSLPNNFFTTNVSKLFFFNLLTCSIQFFCSLLLIF